MDAIIMAGGKGTRMRPLTDTTPKPLIPIQGRPILDWTLEVLRPSVDRVLVVVSYLKEQLEAYMAAQQHFADYVTVEQLPEPMGTGHAVQCCQPHLHSDAFLVINGDDFYDAAAVTQLASLPLGIMGIQRDDQARWGVIVTDDSGRVLRLHEKPAEGTYPTPINANIGAYKLHKRIFDYDLPLSARGEYELTDYVTWLCAQPDASVAVVQANFWMPMGYPQDVEAAHQMDLRRLIFG